MIPALSHLNFYTAYDQKNISTTCHWVSVCLPFPANARLTNLLFAANIVTELLTHLHRLHSVLLKLLDVLLHQHHLLL